MPRYVSQILHSKYAMNLIITKYISLVESHSVTAVNQPRNINDSRGGWFKTGFQVPALKKSMKRGRGNAGLGTRSVGLKN